MRTSPSIRSPAEAPGSVSPSVTSSMRSHVPLPARTRREGWPGQDASGVVRAREGASTQRVGTAEPGTSRGLRDPAGRQRLPVETVDRARLRLPLGAQPPVPATLRPRPDRSQADARVGVAGRSLAGPVGGARPSSVGQLLARRSELDGGQVEVHGVPHGLARRKPPMDEERLRAVGTRRQPGTQCHADRDDVLVLRGPDERLA